MKIVALDGLRGVNGGRFRSKSLSVLEQAASDNSWGSGKPTSPISHPKGIFSVNFVILVIK